MKILHLSDTHLTGDDRLLFGSSPRERLAAAIDAIRRDHADASFCLFTGDLAENGALAAYRQLADLAATLPMPCHFLAGNHDARSQLLQVLAPDHPHSQSFVQQVIDTEQGRFLLLDTQRKASARGELCETRRAWLREQLEAAAPEQGFWLVMHHPPLALGIPSMDQYALEQAELLWETLRPHRQRIRHILFGHVHRAISGSWHGIAFSCCKSTNHQVALDLVTRSVDVPGSHDAPGFSVILIEPERVVVHHQEFLAKGPAFFL